MSDATYNPWAHAQAQLEPVLARLEIERGLAQVLRTPRRELTVSVPFRRDDGETVVAIGHRVQHSTALGPAKGGMRPSTSDRTRRCRRSKCRWSR